ncbi:putative mitochondrial protein [Cucumis melo var. makuwa]|uniref:Mitochondrial protein n=1 Tax=Cucumis melo var. makuwa TaxID=1194695 RepID=A0A5A7SQ82_CUCMM|nr:putative mitochondrial protein [Cucumis melo var. makuwa]
MLSNPIQPKPIYTPNVDDIVLSGNDNVEIIQLKKRIGDEFEIKDIGNLKSFLLIEGFGLADTPTEFNCKLENSGDHVLVDKEQYRRLVNKMAKRRNEANCKKNTWKNLAIRKLLGKIPTHHAR